MQGEMIERRRRRRRSQVHELFSNATESPEIWNEISSYDNKAFDLSDWRNLAFDAVHSGQLSLLKWLISTKKVPILIRNGKGCNLLHAAASFGQESIAEWLLDTDENSYSAALELFLGKSKRRRTALEIAVHNNQFDMVECLLNMGSMGVTSTLRSQVFNDVRHCCQIAGPGMASYLKGHLQTLEIRAFLSDLSIGSHLDVESFIAKVTVFPWWENVGNMEWNELEKFALYVALLSAASIQNVDLVKWLLNKWKVSLEPPSFYHWKGLSIADVVAMGKINYDQEFLENVYSGDEAEDHNEVWQRHSKRFFDWAVSGRWEDGQSSSLISTLEPQIYLEKAGHCRENKWFEVLYEHDHEGRLAVLKILSQKYEDHGAQSFALPRLDVVVACNQLHALQWLIDSRFVDLKLPLSTSNGEAMEVEENQDEEVIPDDNNVCAICYTIKRFPEELQCGHSYCLSCICRVLRYAHENMQSFQCPYCRRHITVPPSMTLSASLQYYLTSKLPWLQYRSSNTIGEILMALAAGTGSVFILEYLIIQQHVDPLTTLFANGRNVMHIAASRGNIVACKWLCSNGYRQLAGRLSHQQLSPVHEAINSPNSSASLVFDLFEQLKVLPDDWITLTSTSSNTGVVRSAELSLSHECTIRIFELLAGNAPLNQLTSVIDKSSFGRCEILHDEELIDSIMERIIQCGRADVLIWMYNSCPERRMLYFEVQDLKFIRQKIGKANVNRSVMNAFIEEIDAGRKLSCKIAKCSSDFNKLILNGAPISKIEEVINQQNELISQAQKPSLLERDICKISFEGIVQHGLNALETAAKHGHLQLVDWILNMPDMNTVQSIEQVFSSAILAGSFAVFDFALSWLDEHKQPIPTFIHTFKSEPQSLLHTIVSQFATYCCFLNSDGEAKALHACFDMSKLLIGRSDIDANSLNDKNQTALYHLADIRHFIKREGQVFPNASEIISDRVVEMIQMLVNAGTDLHNIDIKNQTFFELVLSKGSPLLLKSIRWLALDKGVDIQFVQFSSFQFDSELQQRAENEFKAIREEQRSIQSLQR